MTRLIDADKIIRFLNDEYHGMISDESMKIYQIEIMIDNAPTVDAVEVVRCKDCKHWDSGTGWCSEHSSFIDEKGVKCHPWESSNWRMFDENDYCSVGERRYKHE